MNKKSGVLSPRTTDKPGANKGRSTAAATSDKPAPSGGAAREVVESIVVAFVLAFLFRTFEAEAFVIPTGSMATTLMGRHKDVECSECGYRFRISASEEMNNETNQPKDASIVAGTCPMCRYTMIVGPDNPQGGNYPSYKGDRILVSKFPYEFHDPERWDVAVFKYPGEAKTNYIKRIVGLPNETVRINHGDIFTRPAGEQAFTIQRKPEDRLLAMLQPVYANDYTLANHVKLGWPARWASWPPAKSGQPGAWASTDLKRFTTDGSASEEVWLRYRHVVPTPNDWQWLAQGAMPPTNPDPQPQLITDFAAYNTQVAAPNGARLGHLLTSDPRPTGMQWVGDLALRCETRLLSDKGELILELVEGGQRFQCRLRADSGEAQLEIVDHPEFGLPKATTAIRGGTVHRVMFANIDQQLRLWVDAQEVQFDRPTTYDPLGNDMPTAEDLEPVRIGAYRAAAEVAHLEILRDIYYIAVHGRNLLNNGITDYQHSPLWGLSEVRAAEVLSDPRQWQGFQTARSVEFELEADQFFMLGDNSPESKDSRLWPAEGYEHYVRRDLLIGKALLIYWPHGWDIPGTDLPIKLLPNLARMGFVR